MQKTYLQKTCWWFLRCLTAWSELPNWWRNYKREWREVVFSLVEFVVLILSPLLALFAPVLALIQHIKECQTIEAREDADGINRRLIQEDMK